jgi:hypothetical protein
MEDLERHIIPTPPPSSSHHDISRVAASQPSVEPRYKVSIVDGVVKEYPNPYYNPRNYNNQAPAVSPLLENAITSASIGDFTKLIINLSDLGFQPDNWFDQDENGNTILIVLALKLSLPLVLTDNNNAKLMTCVNLILDKQDKYTIGAKVNIKNKAGDSAIILAGKGAAANNDITKQFIDAIVEKGAYINDSNNGTNAFTNAANKGNLVIAHYILLKEAIMLANKPNETTIDINTQKDNILKILNILPTYKWFDQDGRGETILIRLADKGNLELVKHILENATTNDKRGASLAQVNLKNNNGNSAIILTGRTNKNYNYAAKEIIKALMEKGANINAVNNESQSASTLAQIFTGNTELKNFIDVKMEETKIKNGGKRTAKKSRKSRKMRKRKARKTRRVR